MSNPKISVIIPVYNAEPFIEKCVNSVLMQKYKNIEIILVDDGSTDDSGTICDRLGEQSALIRVYHKENEGESLTREFGVRKATGDFIAWVDADDWIEDDYIERMSERMREDDNIDMSVGLFIQEDINGKILSIPNAEAPHYIDSDNGLIEMFQVEKWGGAGCVKVMRKSLYDGYEADAFYRIGNDLVNMVKLIKKARRIYYTAVAGYHYVQNPFSQCHDVDYDKQLDYLKFYGIYYAGQDVKDSPRLALAVRKRFQGAYEYAIGAMLEQNYSDVRRYFDIYDKNLSTDIKSMISESSIEGYGSLVWIEKRYKYCLGEESVLNFLDNYWNDYKNAEHVFVYGAGEYSKIAINRLEVNNIDIEGYIVSDGQPKPDHRKYPVLWVSEIREIAQNIAVMVGLDENNTQKLLPYINGIGFGAVHILL